MAHGGSTALVLAPLSYFTRRFEAIYISIYLTSCKLATVASDGHHLIGSPRTPFSTRILHCRISLFA